ncbi:4Fe-4S domain-containing protein [Streptomyces sp. NPDC060209]|uniref:4Fe-4S domain-containing protein n=1 Tax=Streptomyces sp. NPDC060209 TaxID=3347073 RepID=UPI0036689298
MSPGDGHVIRSEEAPEPPAWQETLWARVEPGVCIGSGICLATAPRHFEPSGHTHSRTRSDAPVADSAARDAADLCPVEAIRLVGTPPATGPVAPTSL